MHMNVQFVSSGPDGQCCGDEGRMVAMRASTLPALTTYTCPTLWLKKKRRSVIPFSFRSNVVVLYCAAMDQTSENALAICLPSNLPAHSLGESSTNLTRVMSPNCTVCRQQMGSEVWVCCRCYTYGHSQCIRITVVEGYPFCDQCTSWAQQEVQRVNQQQQIVAWKQSMQSQLEGWKKASIFAAGTLSTIGLAVGGTTAAIAHGSVALIRGVAAGAAAASSTGEKIQQAASAARSTSLRAEDSAKNNQQDPPSLPPIPEPPIGPPRPERKTQRSLPGIASAASTSGFCLACHTHNPSHLAHLYYGDCRRTKKGTSTRRSTSTPPTARASPPATQATPMAAPTSEGSQVQAQDAEEEQEEVVYAGSNVGTDARPPQDSPVPGGPSSFRSVDGDMWDNTVNTGGLMRALQDLALEVRSNAHRMDVLMDSMTAVEAAMTTIIDRMDTLTTTTKDLKEQMESWNTQEDNDGEDEMQQTFFSARCGVL